MRANGLIFADDAALLAEESPDMERTLSALDTLWDLNVNIS